MNTAFSDTTNIIVELNQINRYQLILSSGQKLVSIKVFPQTEADIFPTFCHFKSSIIKFVMLY